MGRTMTLSTICAGFRKCGVYPFNHLVQFVPDAKPQSKQQMVRISGARVLTGDTCAVILQEREEKKQKEKAEKKKRKLLREQMKKEKEEELRRKKAALAQKKATAAEKRAVGKTLLQGRDHQLIMIQCRLNQMKTRLLENDKQVLTHCGISEYGLMLYWTLTYTCTFKLSTSRHR